jgi:hypothetical protein
MQPRGGAGLTSENCLSFSPRLPLPSAEIHFECEVRAPRFISLDVFPTLGQMGTAIAPKVVFALKILDLQSKRRRRGGTGYHRNTHVAKLDPSEYLQEISQRRW